MRITKIGIIREDKNPADSRTPLTPDQVMDIKSKFGSIDVFVESSPVRCYQDNEYAEPGIKVIETIKDCDIYLGVKEVPVDKLNSNKTYLFFSHTIKKQLYNRHLLQSILKKKIRLIDYECLVKDNKRVIAFGKWAGIVGAYNGLLGYGKRYNLFHLKRAYKCDGLEELKTELKKANFLPIKIVLTGKGRVGMGAAEILNFADIRKVRPVDFIDRSFSEPVYTQIDVDDYHRHKDGISFQLTDFFTDPGSYRSTFYDFAKSADILISAIFWDPKAPTLFSLKDMNGPDFRLKLIADITCDINGSIPSTQKACTIADPFYDFNPVKNKIMDPFSNEDNVTVMAIDNLPNELPREASKDFGNQLINNVLPDLLSNKPSDIIRNATITENGKLTKPFRYLSDYIKG